MGFLSKTRALLESGSIDLRIVKSTRCLEPQLLGRTLTRHLHKALDRVTFEVRVQK